MEKIERPITDFIPDGWFSDNAKSAFWVTGYQIIHSGELEGIHIYDFCDARVIVLRSEFKYPRIVEEPNLDVEGGIVTITGQRLDVYEAPLASYLLILQPYIVDGMEHSEYKVKKNASMIAGLYAAVNGYNMAYKRTFDFYCSMDGQVACSSHMFINPAAFPVPDLSTDRLEEIHDFGKKLDLMELTKRNRTKLALYWFEQGLRSNGLDGFINIG